MHYALNFTLKVQLCKRNFAILNKMGEIMHLSCLSLFHYFYLFYEYHAHLQNLWNGVEIVDTAQVSPSKLWISHLVCSKKLSYKTWRSVHTTCNNTINQCNCHLLIKPFSLGVNNCYCVVPVRVTFKEHEALECSKVTSHVSK